MNDTALKVENLGKKYRIGGLQDNYRQFRDVLMDSFISPLRRLTRIGKPPPPKEIIWALKDVSFEVKRGEVLGIIGKNGAGKSTLLKILSRITTPTEGRVEIRGRVGSLLEVGTGFHPEMTGRENIYLNGGILGMTRAEIRDKFDEIVDFSGIGKFIDTPVKRFSSGMYVRLAFSIAAHMEPEILLVDEVLAVGDSAFQKKCLGKMGDVASEGRTVLLVSHNMVAIAGLCSRAIWIDAGRKRAEGPASQVTRDYLAASREYRESLPPIAERTDRQGAGRIRFTGFQLRDEAGCPINCVRLGDTVEFVLTYVTPGEWISNVSVQIVLRDTLGRDLMTLGSSFTGEDFERLPPRGEIICRVPRFPLAPGMYTVDVGAAVSHHSQSASGDVVFDAAKVEVAAGDFYGTGQMPSRADIYCEHSWRVGESNP